jgi:predicted metalloendopeptidase
MDPSVDPCQDYFSYACGGFVKNSVIPSDRTDWSIYDQIEESNQEFLRDVLERAAKSPGDDPARKKLGDYYAACMDEDAVEKAGIEPIKPLLADAAKVTDTTSLAVEAAKLHAFGIHPLFELIPQQDFADATRIIASLDQPRQGLPDRDYYLKDEGNLKDVRAFYRGHVERMFALLGLKPAEAKQAADDTLRIETKIAQVSQDKVARNDPRLFYHHLDRAGLAALTKAFPWDRYWDAVGLKGVSELTVNEPAFYTAIDRLMTAEKPAAWRHYLAWRIVSAKAPLLSKAFQREWLAMREKIAGQHELPPRWKKCVRDVDRDLGELLAQPYVAEKFAGDSRDRARELLRSIHEAMRTELGQLDWLDGATRAAALAKLDAIHDKVGYPDRWRTYDFEVSRSGYAANVLRATAFEQRRRLAKIGRPIDRTEWEDTPPTVDAYYSFLFNEIVVPAGELQAPLFSRTFYPPVNIGDEGANTMGHELTHAFDPAGSQFDGSGNMREWWTKETRAKFEAATKCVADQYSAYEVLPGVKLDGALTASEDVADIGGVKLGYAALQTWEKAHPEERRVVDGFTDEKIFFLAYAQGWCSKATTEMLEMRARSDERATPRWRVNGPMADVPAFAQAYACKVGTPMNTGKVCSIW